MTRKTTQRRLSLTDTYSDGLDFGLSALLLSLLVYLASGVYAQYLVRSELADAFSSLTQLRLDIEEAYAVHGDWPNLGHVEPFGTSTGGSRFIAQATVEHGAITYLFGNETKGLMGRSLTLRPIIPIDDPTGPVSWLCGYAVTPTGLATHATNHTDIPVTLLPAFCRM